MLLRILIIFTYLSSFIPVQVVYADVFLDLPKPGEIVNLSPSFNPSVLKGLKVYPEDPLKFGFILDQGSSHLTESTKLIKYFLASLTIPEQDLWVNLSPYERNRIIPNSFGLTEMGRDLLAEDYMLKQITASLIYPEGETGKKFWKEIYAQAAKRFGTTNIPVNTFNKVWIVPEKAVVYENAKAGTAYVVEAKLKVMLEEDYLSLTKHGIRGVAEGWTEGETRGQDPETGSLGAQIIREIVLPQLTKEINENKNFAQLRQVYNSLILATWYKKKISAFGEKENILSQVYVDKNKVAGIMSSPKSSLGDPQYIYQQYLKAFKKGVFNFIKEEQDPKTQATVVRKYFSGGVRFDLAQISYTSQIPHLTSHYNYAIIARLSANAAMNAKAVETKVKPKEYSKHTDVVFTKTNLINLLVNGQQVWDYFGQYLHYIHDVSVSVKGETFHFHITIKGSSETFYTLPVDEFEQLLDLTGWQLKEQLPLLVKGDFVLSRQGFENNFVDGRLAWYKFQKEVGFTKYDHVFSKRIFVQGRAFDIVRKRSANYRVGLTIAATEFNDLMKLEGWKFKPRSTEIDKSRYAYPNTYDGVDFASKLERDTYIVLKQLKLVGLLEKGVNFQVEVPQRFGQSIEIDFVTAYGIFEPHWEPDSDKQENYLDKRVFQIRHSEYRHKTVFTFSSIRKKDGLYDLLGLTIDQRLELEKIRKGANKDTVWLDPILRPKNEAMLSDPYVLFFAAHFREYFEALKDYDSNNNGKRLALNKIKIGLRKQAGAISIELLKQIDKLLSTRVKVDKEYRELITSWDRFNKEVLLPRNIFVHIDYAVEKNPKRTFLIADVYEVHEILLGQVPGRSEVYIIIGDKFYPKGGETDVAFSIASNIIFINSAWIDEFVKNTKNALVGKPFSLQFWNQEQAKGLNYITSKIREIFEGKSDEEIRHYWLNKYIYHELTHQYQEENPQQFIGLGNFGINDTKAEIEFKDQERQIDTEAVALLSQFVHAQDPRAELVEMFGLMTRTKLDIYSMAVRWILNTMDGQPLEQWVNFGKCQDIKEQFMRLMHKGPNFLKEQAKHMLAAYWSQELMKGIIKAEHITQNKVMSADHLLASKDLGGIDLTVPNISVEGGRIKFYLDPAMLAELQNASGFTMVIISMQRVTNLNYFLSSIVSKPYIQS